MTRAAKRLARMEANPVGWRIEDLQIVAEAHGLLWRAPGGSHVIFRHRGGAMLSVPARRPIKPIYVMKFVVLVETGQT